MGDVQRCGKCGSDRLADVIKHGQALCAECAGEPRAPSALDQFKKLTVDRQRFLRDQFTAKPRLNA